MVLRVKVGNEVGSLMGCQEGYWWEAGPASKGIVIRIPRGDAEILSLRE